MISKVKVMERSQPPRQSRGLISARAKAEVAERKERELFDIRVKAGSVKRSPRSSEFFGKIVKQGAKANSNREEINKENCQEENIPMGYAPHSPVKNYTGKRWKHLDLLLEKQKSLGIYEPLDRFIYLIFKRGRANFEEKAKRLRSISSNVAREVQRESPALAKPGELTFTPELLKGLMSEVYSHKRWYKLYLIKILYKEPLLKDMKELIKLSEKAKKAYSDYSVSCKKFNKLKYLLVHKSGELYTSAKRAEATQQNIEELNKSQLEAQSEYQNCLARV